MTCSIKQNEEPEGTAAATLQQRKEKKMNIEITLHSAAATSQWVKLPAAAEHIADDNTKEHQAFSLSLIVGGHNHGGVLGGVGPYHPTGTEVIEFLRVAGFHPTLEIGVGKTVNIGFKFKKYPRDLDTREQAFRSVPRPFPLNYSIH